MDIRAEQRKLKDIYENVYSNRTEYNEEYLEKATVISLLLAPYRGQAVLDAGCGKGNHLRRMLADGHNAFGIEMSQTCCEKYLKGLPHLNSDIVAHSTGGKTYDVVLCMDVLEHIPESLLSSNLAALESLGPHAILGIANHSDIINGEELHVIQQPPNWWKQQLEKHYDVVTVLDAARMSFDKPTDKATTFFFVLCSRASEADSQQREMWVRMEQQRQIFVNELLGQLFEDNSLWNKGLTEQIARAEANFQKLEMELSEAHFKLSVVEERLARIDRHPAVRLYRFLRGH